MLPLLFLAETTLTHTLWVRFWERGLILESRILCTHSALLLALAEVPFLTQWFHLAVDAGVDLASFCHWLLSILCLPVDVHISIDLSAFTHCKLDIF